MEFGGASDGVLVSLQRATSLCDRGVEIVDGCEMSIDERLVDEGPKVLCRLQLRAVGGLEDQPDAVGNGEVFRTVPAGLVEYDNDDALAAGTGLGHFPHPCRPRRQAPIGATKVCRSAACPLWSGLPSGTCEPNVPPSKGSRLRPVQRSPSSPPP